MTDSNSTNRVRSAGTSRPRLDLLYSPNSPTCKRTPSSRWRRAWNTATSTRPLPSSPSRRFSSRELAMDSQKKMRHSLQTYRMRGLTTDEKVVSELVETLNGKLAGYETVLSKQKYLAGNVSHSKHYTLYHILTFFVSSGGHARRLVRSLCVSARIMILTYFALAGSTCLTATCSRQFVLHSPLLDQTPHPVTPQQAGYDFFKTKPNVERCVLLN
jgi:hypothetical protein